MWHEPLALAVVALGHPGRAPRAIVAVGLSIAATYGQVLLGAKLWSCDAHAAANWEKAAPSGQLAKKTLAAHVHIDEAPARVAGGSGVCGLRCRRQREKGEKG